MVYCTSIFLLNVCLYFNLFNRGPRGRLAMPNELPSINKDFHFTSLQEIAQSERNSHFKNRGGKNLINNRVLILRKYIASRMGSHKISFVAYKNKSATRGAQLVPIGIPNLI